jgi:hypothetical protein
MPTKTSPIKLFLKLHFINANRPMRCDIVILDSASEVTKELGQDHAHAQSVQHTLTELF